MSENDTSKNPNTQGFCWLPPGHHEGTSGNGSAAYDVNLIVHRTNPRLEADLKITVDHKVPLVITSLSAVKDPVDAVHSCCGAVFHDVTNIRHAQKAVEAGIDSLILVCGGAGGHAGTYSPFVFLSKVR